MQKGTRRQEVAREQQQQQQQSEKSKRKPKTHKTGYHYWVKYVCIYVCTHEQICVHTYNMLCMYVCMYINAKRNVNEQQQQKKQQPSMYIYSKDETTRATKICCFAKRGLSVHIHLIWMRLFFCTTSTTRVIKQQQKQQQQQQRKILKKLFFALLACVLPNEYTKATTRGCREVSCCI